MVADDSSSINLLISMDTFKILVTTAALFVAAEAAVIVPLPLGTEGALRGPPTPVDRVRPSYLSTA